MDKNAIKTFAVESRRKMIESVKYQASLLGITADEIREPIAKAEGMETYDYGAGQHSIFNEDIKKRQSLVKEINNKGFDNVVEEVAYTWFNRIIAIRFMEVNDYLPTRTRVLSSDTGGKLEPDIITEAFDLDLDFSDEDREKILKFKEDNENDKLFQLLFIRQCNKLNEILPALFEKTDDYMELLLDISYTDENGVVRKLVDTISEEDFGEQVEIIGWLYQFYNSELKDETFSNLKKGIKIGKDRIPAATQLFTPDWIVKYMVENSVGRLWLEGHPNQELKSKWDYFLEDVNQSENTELELVKIRKEFSSLSLKDIKIIDPCMGSGHILVYVFDLLIQIYVSEGYTVEQATELILKNNLYGLDIDERAYQLAYFALMMKARQYNRKIFNLCIIPSICAIKESKDLSMEFIETIISHIPKFKEELLYVIKLFKDAKEFGSIIKVNSYDWEELYESINNITLNNDLNKFKFFYEMDLLKSLINQCIKLSDNYDVVITNPPYMGNKNMSKKLVNYLKDNYPISKLDLSTVFMEQAINLTKTNGFISMINIPVWMFLSSYESLREFLLNNITFINMLHLGRGVFGSDFGTTSFLFINNQINCFNSLFRQLFEDVFSVDDISTKEKWFFENNKSKNSFVFNQNDFNRIPGKPIAYWTSKNMLQVINSNHVKEFTVPKAGVVTGNDKYFVRYWHEINFKEIVLEPESQESYGKYHIFHKGGFFRKYYGNNDYVIKLKDLYDDRKCNKSVRRGDKNYYFKKGIGWSQISSKNTRGFRVIDKSICGTATPTIYLNDENIFYYMLGFLNSHVSREILAIYNSTVNLLSSDVSNLPFTVDYSKIDEVNKLTKELINIAYTNWNDQETSIDFRINPLLKRQLNNSNLNQIFDEYFNQCITYEKIWVDNEYYLNKIFMDIYGLTKDDGIDDNISKKDITLIKNEKIDVIKQFISYAVGCMFGRYSLDEEGLQFAGGEFDISKYSKFIPDDDNIMPVLDTEYFNDDIVGRFVEFVKVCFGEETLEENLDFIAGALKKKGKTSREIIRNYFLTDFFKDHAQTYKKCPIYWQFDSGKQNAFKCLIYLHRYEPGLVARVRTDYLHKTQKAIEQNLAHCESIIANSSNKSEVSKATKDKSKYIKQLDEIKVYDEALAHMANQQIEIDLDDGVKVNHAKFQNVEIFKEGQKVKKINLLKKI